MDGTPAKARLAHNVTRLSRLDLPGAGQVYVDGKYAYIGHIPNKQQLGTSILDVSDPKNPKIVSQITLDDPESHSHKARVRRRHHDRQQRAQHDRDRPQGRRAAEAAHAACATRSAASRRTRSSRRSSACRSPTSPRSKRRRRTRTATAASRSTTCRTARSRSSISLREDRRHRRAPLRHGRELRLHLDRGRRLRRQHPRASTTSAIPRSRRKSRSGGCPGQHVAGGEKQTWPGRQHRLHHTLRVGDRLYAGCWHGGVRIVDVSDIRKPKTIGAYNYHPPFPGAFAHVHGAAEADRRQRTIAIAIDEEDHAHSAEEMARRRGRPHGCAVDVRHHRSREHPAARDLRSERARFAVEPRDAGALRRAPVPGAHERRRHAGLLRVVRGRLAHRRRRRPDRAAGSRLVHPRARGRAKPRRRPTTSTSTSAGSSTSSIGTRGSTCWSSSGAESCRVRNERVADAPTAAELEVACDVQITRSPPPRRASSPPGCRETARAAAPRSAFAPPVIGVAM